MNVIIYIRGTHAARRKSQGRRHPALPHLPLYNGSHLQRRERQAYSSKANINECEAKHFKFVYSPSAFQAPTSRRDERDEGERLEGKRKSAMDDRQVAAKLR